METFTNQQCASCDSSHFGVNGCYCNKLHHYVEYAKEPPCGKK